MEYLILMYLENARSKSSISLDLLFLEDFFGFLLRDSVIRFEFEVKDVDSAHEVFKTGDGQGVDVVKDVLVHRIPPSAYPPSCNQFYHLCRYIPNDTTSAREVRPNARPQIPLHTQLRYDRLPTATGNPNVSLFLISVII